MSERRTAPKQPVSLPRGNINLSEESAVEDQQDNIDQSSEDEG